MPKVLPIDQLPGEVTFGNLTESSANTFTAAQIPDDIVSPDIIIDKDLFLGGGLNIEQVLAWDVYAWEPFTNARADISAGLNLVQEFNGGITKENTVDSSDGPTADTNPQETRPGAGNAASNTNYVRRWTWGYGANESEDATGQINRPTPDAQKFEKEQMTILTPGPRSYYYPMLAAHYHLWGEGFNLNGASVMQLGVQARRIEVEFEELMFDREAFLGILGFVGNIVV